MLSRWIFIDKKRFHGESLNEIKMPEPVSCRNFPCFVRKRPLLSVVS